MRPFELRSVRFEMLDDEPGLKCRLQLPRPTSCWLYWSTFLLGCAEAHCSTSTVIVIALSAPESLNVESLREFEALARAKPNTLKVAPRPDFLTSVSPAGRTVVPIVP
jgi:hypothetical protein